MPQPFRRALLLLVVAVLLGPTTGVYLNGITVLHQPPAPTVAFGTPAKVVSGGPSPAPAAGVANWTDLAPPVVPPGGRVTTHLAYDAGDGCAVLFGGVAYSRVFGDTWEFANGAWTNVTPAVLNATNSPSPRWGAAMTYDAKDGYLLLFGGASFSSSHPLNDTWKFRGGTWTNITPPSSPASRDTTEIAYDAKDGYVLLYGGLTKPSYGLTGNQGFFGDTWKFANGTWSRLAPVASPPARGDATMAYDASDGYLILFGGSNGTDLNDTWAFSGGNWTNLTGSKAPPPRHEASMSFDPNEGYVILFGGLVASSCNAVCSRETWAFKNALWTNLAPLTAPGFSWAAGMAFDSRDGYTVMFDLKTYGFGSVVVLSASASPVAMDVGQSTTLQVTLAWTSPSTTFSYSGLPPGCSSVDSARLACIPSSPGVFETRVNVHNGYNLSRNLSLNVYPDPEIRGFNVTPATVSLGEAVRFTVTSRGDPGLRYGYSGLPAGCVTRNASNLTCTPTAPGIYLARATIIDMRAFAVSANATVVINPDPSLLSFRATPSAIDLGQPVLIQANATGGTGSLGISYSGLPSGCASVNRSTFGCVPTATGVFSLIAHVSDSTGRESNSTTQLEVNPDLAIHGFGPSTPAIDVGQSVTFTLNSTGGTGWTQLSYSGLPSGCTSLNVSAFSCVVTASGTYSVRADLLDSVGGSTNGSARLVVNPDLSVISFRGSLPAIDLGQSVLFSAKLEGGTGPITYDYGGFALGWCSTANATELACAPRATGTLHVTVTGTDAVGGRAGATTSLSVVADLTIVSMVVDPTVIFLGKNATTSVEVAGGTGSRAISYSGLPPGCHSSNQSTLTCAPRATGTFNLTGRVTDASGFVVSANVTLTVLSNPSNTTTVLFPVGLGLGLVIGAGLGVLGASVVYRSRRGDRDAVEEIPMESTEVG